jgi:hypothetical protein
MEIAVPMVRHLGPKRSLPIVVEAVRSYAETLTALVEDGIYHRDIKPANLYWLEAWCSR